MSRPRRVVLVVGTGTEVGKTWVTAAVARRLRDSGVSVCARKPVQSFDKADLGETDAEVLAGATGETADVVCPLRRWYETPMAPFMAAAALGRPGFTLHDLVDELAWPDGVDVGFVETAGGVRSPMCSDNADAVDMARAVAPDLIVLVADAGLGTLNSVRLCLDALDGCGPVVVYLNRYDDGVALHRANREWLRANLAVPVVNDVDAVAELISVGPAGIEPATKGL